VQHIKRPTETLLENRKVVRIEWPIEKNASQVRFCEFRDEVEVERLEQVDGTVEAGRRDNFGELCDAVGAADVFTLILPGLALAECALHQ
jgi:hypothetical protein